MTDKINYLPFGGADFGSSIPTSSTPQGDTGRLKGDSEEAQVLSSHADNRIETITVLCCNCYQDRDVRLSSLGEEIKRFYNDHRTRIGRRFCKLEDIGMNRYLYAVTDLQPSDKDVK